MREYRARRRLLAAVFRAIDVGLKVEPLVHDAVHNGVGRRSSERNVGQRYARAAACTAKRVILRRVRGAVFSGKKP